MQSCHSLSLMVKTIRLPRHMTTCPKHFSLKFPAGRSYDCRVCWRVQHKVGVAFV